MKQYITVGELVKSEEMIRGSYVAYHPDIAKDFCVPSSVTGYDLDQFLSTDDSITWHIIYTDKNGITLAPNRVSINTGFFTLRGEVGVMSGADALVTAMRNLYSMQKNGIYARALKIEDVYKFLYAYDKNGWVDDGIRNYIEERIERMYVAFTEYSSKDDSVFAYHNGKKYKRIFIRKEDGYFLKADGGGILTPCVEDKHRSFYKLTLKKPVFVTTEYYKTKDISKKEIASDSFMDSLNIYWLATTMDWYDASAMKYAIAQVYCGRNSLDIRYTTSFDSSGRRGITASCACPVVTIPNDTIIDCTERINHGQSAEHAWQLY